MALNNVQQLLSVYVDESQELEDVYWDIFNSRILDTAIGDQLDNLGKIVGEPRNARADVDYRAAIRIRIRVNRSQGKAIDVIDVCTLSAINSTPHYYEMYPAGYAVDILNLPGGLQVARLLGSTKAGGVAGILNFSPNATLTTFAGFEGDTAAQYLAAGFEGDTTPVLGIDIGAGGV